MATITKEVEIEIGLNRFDDDELLGEVIYRGLTLDDADISDFDDEDILDEAMGRGLATGFEIITGWDRQKLEHLQKVFSKYTLEEIENALPEKF